MCVKTKRSKKDWVETEQHPPHPAQGVYKIESSDTDLRTTMGTTELSRKQVQVTIRRLLLWINVLFWEIRLKLASLKMCKKVGKQHRNSPKILVLKDHLKQRIA